MPYPANLPYTTPSNTTTTYPIEGVVTNASNILCGENPPYIVETFSAIYPQYTDTVPAPVIEMYLNLAHATIKIDRYKDVWAICMGLFVAHFLHLYLQSTAPGGASARAVIAAGEAKGLRGSKSAGGLSTSTDYSAITQDLNGWAAWKLSTFGIQFATFSKMVSKGGIVVW